MICLSYGLSLITFVSDKSLAEAIALLEISVFIC